MAQETQGWITVDEVIAAYLDRSEQSNHKFFKCWNIAFDGLNMLGLDFFYQIKSVKLPLNSNKTVYLPDDFLNYTKVGVFNERGEVIPLVYNEKLTTFADLLPDRKTKTEDNTLFNLWAWNSPIFYNYWNGFAFVNLFGVPSGTPFVGSFKLDRGNGVILLNENFVYPYICLEYLASPQPEGTYRLPIQFKEALIWFIAWQDIAMLPTTSHFNLGGVEQRRRNYFNERRQAIARFKPTYLEQAYEEHLQNQRLCIKS